MGGMIGDGHPRKTGHPLEGSCQEEKPPHYTPSCIFFAEVCCTASRSDLPVRPRPRLQWFGIDRIVATHQTPIRIKAHERHFASWPSVRPLALNVPQKTLGTLPCPIVFITLDLALPNGAIPMLARGRGVANP